MPKIKLLKRVDAYVEYEAEVEATDPQAAVDLAYFDGSDVDWTEVGTQRFDACHVVAIDEDGDEIEGTKWGKG